MLRVIIKYEEILFKDLCFCVRVYAVDGCTGGVVCKQTAAEFQASYMGIDSKIQATRVFVEK